MDKYLITTPGVRLGRRGDAFVLRNVHSRKRWQVNESAALLWQFCVRPVTLDSIERDLVEAFGTEAGLRRQVEATIAEFLDIGVLTDQAMPGLVRARLMGRLGNHLFIHCFARILASRLGCGFQAPPIAGFPNTATGDHRRQEAGDRRTELVLDGQDVDIEELAARRPLPRRVCLQGYFQRYEYYRPYKDLIRNEWLQFEPVAGIDDDAVVVHVRGGDAWQRHSGSERGNQSTVPVSYYRNILGQMRYSRLYIVTERADDPVVHRLRQLYQCEIVSDTPSNDLLFVASSRRLIMSRSTFAWWGAWLSRAVEIHFPCEHCWAPKPKGVSLWVDDEPRYVMHDVDTPRPWRGDDEDIRAMLDA